MATARAPGAPPPPAFGFSNLLAPPGAPWFLGDVNKKEEKDKEDEEEEEEEEEDVVICGGIRPKSSPLPRRRSCDSALDDCHNQQPPPSPGRRVSFADARGQRLVSIRWLTSGGNGSSSSGWDVTGCLLGVGGWGEPGGLLQEEYALSPAFERPLPQEELQRRVQKQKLELESLTLLPGTTTLRGVVRVLNICYGKTVYVRASLDQWKSHFDLLAEYVPTSAGSVEDCSSSSGSSTDCFAFKHTLVPQASKDGARLDFCLRYETDVGTFWANNEGSNYVVFCHKKTEMPKGKDTRSKGGRPPKKSCLKTVSKYASTNPNTNEVQEELSPGDDACVKQDTPAEAQHKAEQREKLTEEKKQNHRRRKRRRAAKLAQMQDHFASTDTEDKQNGLEGKNQPSITDISNPDHQSKPSSDNVASQEKLAEITGATAALNLAHNETTSLGLPQEESTVDICNQSLASSNKGLKSKMHPHIVPPASESGLVSKDRCDLKPIAKEADVDMKTTGESTSPQSENTETNSKSNKKPLKKQVEKTKSDASLGGNRAETFQQNSEKDITNVNHASLYTFETVVAPLYHQVFTRMDTKSKHENEKELKVDSKHDAQGDINTLSAPKNAPKNVDRDRMTESKSARGAASNTREDEILNDILDINDNKCSYLSQNEDAICSFEALQDRGDRKQPHTHKDTVNTPLAELSKGHQKSTSVACHPSTTNTLSDPRNTMESNYLTPPEDVNFEVEKSNKDVLLPPCSEDQLPMRVIGRPQQPHHEEAANEDEDTGNTHGALAAQPHDLSVMWDVETTALENLQHTQTLEGPGDIEILTSDETGHESYFPKPTIPELPDVKVSFQNQNQLTQVQNSDLTSKQNLGKVKVMKGQSYVETFEFEPTFTSNNQIIPVETSGAEVRCDEAEADISREPCLVVDKEDVPRGKPQSSSPESSFCCEEIDNTQTNPHKPIPTVITPIAHHSNAEIVEDTPRGESGEIQELDHLHQHENREGEISELTVLEDGRQSLSGQNPVNFSDDNIIESISQFVNISPKNVIVPVNIHDHYSVYTTHIQSIHDPCLRPNLNADSQILESARTQLLSAPDKDKIKDRKHIEQVRSDFVVSQVNIETTSHDTKGTDREETNAIDNSKMSANHQESSGEVKPEHMSQTKDGAVNKRPEDYSQPPTSNPDIFITDNNQDISYSHHPLVQTANTSTKKDENKIQCDDESTLKPAKEQDLGEPENAPLPATQTCIRHPLQPTGVDQRPKSLSVLPCMNEDIVHELSSAPLLQTALEKSQGEDEMEVPAVEPPHGDDIDTVTDALRGLQICDMSRDYTDAVIDSKTKLSAEGHTKPTCDYYVDNPVPMQPESSLGDINDQKCILPAKPFQNCEVPLATKSRKDLARSLKLNPDETCLLSQEIAKKQLLHISHTEDRKREKDDHDLSSLDSDKVLTQGGSNLNAKCTNEEVVEYSERIPLIVNDVPNERQEELIQSDNILETLILDSVYGNTLELLKSQDESSVFTVTQNVRKVPHHDLAQPEKEDSTHPTHEEPTVQETCPQLSEKTEIPPQTIHGQFSNTCNEMTKECVQSSTNSVILTSNHTQLPLPQTSHTTQTCESGATPGQSILSSLCTDDEEMLSISPEVHETQEIPSGHPHNQTIEIKEEYVEEESKSMDDFLNDMDSTDATTEQSFTDQNYGGRETMDDVKPLNATIITSHSTDILAVGQTKLKECTASPKQLRDSSAMHGENEKMEICEKSNPENYAEQPNDDDGAEQTDSQDAVLILEHRDADDATASSGRISSTDVLTGDSSTTTHHEGESELDEGEFKNTDEVKVEESELAENENDLNQEHAEADYDYCSANSVWISKKVCDATLIDSSTDTGDGDSNGVNGSHQETQCTDTKCTLDINAKEPIKDAAENDSGSGGQGENMEEEEENEQPKEQPIEPLVCSVETASSQEEDMRCESVEAVQAYGPEEDVPREDAGNVDEEGEEDLGQRERSNSLEEQRGSESDPADDASESLSDDEMELYMHALRATQKSQGKDGKRPRKRDSAMSAFKRSSARKARESLPSISESVDEEDHLPVEDQLPVEEQPPEQDSCLHVVGKTASPVAASENTVDTTEVNWSWWTESFTVQNISRVIVCMLLFVIFMVTTYYYDFMACAVLYVLTGYWLWWQSETQHVK